MDKNILTDNDFSSIDDSMLSPIKIKKIKFFYSFIILIILILAGRLVWLQVIKGVEYRDTSEGNRRKLNQLRPREDLFMML